MPGPSMVRRRSFGSSLIGLERPAAGLNFFACMSDCQRRLCCVESDGQRLRNLGVARVGASEARLRLPGLGCEPASLVLGGEHPAQHVGDVLVAGTTGRRRRSGTPARSRIAEKARAASTSQIVVSRLASRSARLSLSSSRSRRRYETPRRTAAHVAPGSIAPLPRGARITCATRPSIARAEQRRRW